MGTRLDSCFSTEGTTLTVAGIYNLPISILGLKTEHLFRVIKGLKESIILGANFIIKHLLHYDPKFKQVKWRHEKEWAVSAIKVTNQTVIPKYSSHLMKVKLDTGAENS
jgi:hypothetical protein